MDEAVNAFFDFNEYTEVCEVAHFGGVFRADGVFLFDILPGILFELFDAEAHLALVAVESEHNGFHFVADFHEVLGAAEVLAPRHFAYVDETFYAGSDFNECTVVSHDDNAAIDFVAHFDVGSESIPGMGLELLETEGDTFLLVVEVEDNHIELLVEADNFFGVVYAAPRKVCDVYETVDTTQVDEYTVGSDVFNGSLKHLAFFEFGDDFAFLLLEFGFDESFVADTTFLNSGLILTTLNSMVLPTKIS